MLSPELARKSREQLSRPQWRLISSSRDLADLDGLFQYLSQPPQGRHRDIGRVPTDRDWDQGGTHRVSRRIDVVPCPAEVDLRDTMKIGRLQPRRIARGIAGGMPSARQKAITRCRVSRRIDVVPCPAEVDLRDTMKIGRLQPWRIARA